MTFQKAVKHESKLRLAITGPSGAGKTYTALNIAKHLAAGKIAVVDTEHGSASKYADIFEFDVLEMQPPYSPLRFVEFIAEAAAEGYKVIILDSLTHAWSGTGGMLDLVDEIAKRNARGGTPNSFAAWKDAGPIQSKMIEAIVGAPIHVIATMRSKQDYAQEKNEQGKTVVRKVGMAAQQREGFEYEFDVVIDLDIDHNGIITKSRAPVLADKVIAKPGREVADMLNEWLKGAPVATGPAWQQWATPADAYAWAAGRHGIETDLAEASFKQLVALDFGGKLTTGNKARVFEAFFSAEIASKEEAATDPELVIAQ